MNNVIEEIYLKQRLLQVASTFYNESDLVNARSIVGNLITRLEDKSLEEEFL